MGESTEGEAAVYISHHFWNPQGDPTHVWVISSHLVEVDAHLFSAWVEQRISLLKLYCILMCVYVDESIFWYGVKRVTSVRLAATDVFLFSAHLIIP